MKKGVRKGRPVSFAPDAGADPEAASSADVLGLRFEIIPRTGKPLLLDYRDLQPRPMAIAFAGTIRELSALGGPLRARATIQTYKNEGRLFFRFLQAELPKISHPEQLLADHIDQFEDWLSRIGKTRVHLQTILSKTILILRAISDGEETNFDPGLIDRLRYVSDQRFVRPQPRDAYSPAVAKRMREAAMEDIYAMIRRVDERYDLEPTGLAHTYGKLVLDTIERDGVILQTDLIYRRYYAARYRGSGKVGSHANQLHGSYHLLNRDIVPILVFLALETGMEIECIKTLKTDCLSNASRGAANLAYTKRRARREIHKTMRVRDGGASTPAGLIRMILKLTERARRFVPTASIFLHYHNGHLRPGIPGTTHICDAWVRRHGLTDDSGAPLHLVLSRLRKTHKALWYLKSEGHMTRFAIGHTKEVAAQHYADIPALRHLHEGTVAAAFQDAVDGPKIMPTQQGGSDRLDDSPSDKAPVVVIDDNDDVWLARCRGFTTGPFSEEGEACSSPFWGCLECRNAVITEHKLPAILSFLMFIQEQRLAMPYSDWNVKFGRAHHRITEQILPAFDQDVVQRAQDQASHLGQLYFPPEALQ